MAVGAKMKHCTCLSDEGNKEAINAQKKSMVHVDNAYSDRLIVSSTTTYKLVSKTFCATSHHLPKFNKSMSHMVVESGI